MPQPPHQSSPCALEFVNFRLIFYFVSTIYQSISLDTLPFFLAVLLCFVFFLDPRIGIWITCQKASSDFLQKIELYCSAENTEVLHQFAV
jgi:hypothetical protein